MFRKSRLNFRVFHCLFKRLYSAGDPRPANNILLPGSGSTFILLPWSESSRNLCAGSQPLHHSVLPGSGSGTGIQPAGNRRQLREGERREGEEDKSSCWYKKLEGIGAKSCVRIRQSFPFNMRNPHIWGTPGIWGNPRIWRNPRIWEIRKYEEIREYVEIREYLVIFYIRKSFF